MRVKTLELFGFKSFATKTTLHFEPGVTAIVGPNGSGKSNVVDSIRWVLGEHNPRDVRAPRLEDVIFNGTDTRPPLSVAEVHLTIDNASGMLPIAFSEVTISRRVFRSGETECFINQAPCRLKDIRELFLGTGLGGGTYAIIEQGHIDMVLSSKPEERRVVFEEASGVAKYLAKKQETQRRLDEVEEHLVRIADITGEVRRQVSALERQANKARQYKTQWDQLKSLELRLAADELRQGHARFGEVERQLHTLTAQREALEAQRQAQVSASEACNASVSAIQQRLQDLRAAAVACASAVEQHGAQVALKTQWIADLQQQAARLEAEGRELSTRLSQAEAEAARVGGGESALDGQRTTIDAQLAEGRSALDALEGALAQAAHALSEAKARLFEAASEASRQRNEAAAGVSRVQQLDAQLGRLEAQRSQLSARAADLRERRAQAARDHEALRARAEEIQRQVGQTQEALDAAQWRRRELTGRLHQQREQLARARAGAQLAEDLWRRYEGFPEAVKALMGRHVEGLLGPLVDLVQAAPGHEAVVEAALGPLAEALVVQDRRALARCREVLGAEQLEGVRFIVLSDCPSQAAAAERPAHAGARAAVKDYVQAQGAMQPLVDWLLNDSWVIEDFDRILRDGTVAQSRLVSPQGERWDRRSWRVGARGTPAPGRFGRKQRWEEAQAGVGGAEREFQIAEQEAQGAEQEWQSLLARQEAAKGELSHVTPALEKLAAQEQQLTQDAQRLDEEQRALALEAQEALAQRETSAAAAAAAQRAAEASQSRQQAMERALSEAQAAREAETQRRQQLLVARAQVEASRQSLTDRRDALRARRRDLETECLAIAQQIASKAGQRQEAGARAEQLTQEIAAHRQAVAERQQEAQARTGEEAQVAQALREAEAARDQVLPQLLAVEQQMAALANTIHEQSRQLSEREFRRSRLTERLRELYQIDEATLEAEVRAEAPALEAAQRAAMTEEAQRLRAKLEGLGPVSLGSVEEYDELKRRHEFLQAQQQDLSQARDDLKASITQINRTARTQFRETFEKVRQEFQHYFTRLFSGGQADLILLDEEDVLECGIDIVARPPGKRLQSISLLSGGERALTAIALLFALFKVRPSPFCILDEIDAPLDEANVDRFTRVLEEFLALSQFILITHNKKTITRADSLYGVTMQEAGISKILSAKLAGGNGAPAPAAAPSPAAA